MHEGVPPAVAAVRATVSAHARAVVSRALKPKRTCCVHRKPLLASAQARRREVQRAVSPWSLHAFHPGELAGHQCGGRAGYAHCCTLCTFYLHLLAPPSRVPRGQSIVKVYLDERINVWRRSNERARVVQHRQLRPTTRQRRLPMLTTPTRLLAPRQRMQIKTSFPV